MAFIEGLSILFMGMSILSCIVFFITDKMGLIWYSVFLGVLALYLIIKAGL